MVVFIGGIPAPASVVKTDDPTDATNASSYSFAGTSIGTAAIGRRILIGCECVGSSVTGVTVDGNAATLVASNSNCALYIYELDTGTTATIAYTTAAGIVRGGCIVWAVYDLLSSTPTDTDSSAADPANLSINVDAGGIAVAYGAAAGATSTCAWTGLTQSEVDEVIESTGTQHGIFDEFATTQTELSVTATYTGTPSFVGTIAASFR